MKDLQCGTVGLRVMGEPMARNLHCRSFLKALWNRTAPKARKPFLPSLALRRQSLCVNWPKSASRSISVWLTTQAMLSVVEKLLPALTTDHVVIDHSTVSRETACRAAEMVASRGAVFLDAPVSGGVEGARQGTLVIMVGGQKRLLLRENYGEEDISALYRLKGGKNEQ